MVELVRGALLEVAEWTTGVDFGSKDLSRQRLHIPARLKGGGIRSVYDLRQPTFVGAIFDILPRCNEIRDDKGEIVKGVYSEQMGDIIGEGAFDTTGHKNIEF
jgi:hypothetical protein